MSFSSAHIRVLLSAHIRDFATGKIMAITKQKKIETVASVEKALKGAESVVFVNFHKLAVADATALRRALKKEGIGYTVAKKTLIKRVLATLSVSGEAPELQGEIAVAYGNDPIAPARGVYEFQKNLKGAFSIVGGIFGGAYQGKERMTEIASIPSRDVLYGQFLNVINSPIQRIVVVFSKIAGSKSV